MEFTKGNDGLIQKILSTPMPQNMQRPSTFGDYITLQERYAEAYKFFNAKMQFSDEEIADITSYVASFIIHTTDPSGTANLWITV